MATRAVIACLLIAAAGIVGFVVQAPEASAPVLPRAEAVLAGTGWSIQEAYAPVRQGMPAREWLVSDAAGAQAILFLGATSRPQTVFGWSGELGYLGEGYLVESRAVMPAAVGGQRAAVSEVRVRRGDSARELAYAVVRPDGVVATGGDNPVALGWDALSRRGELYYAVRVAVPVQSGSPAGDTTAIRLLTAVLDSVVAIRSVSD